MASHALQRQMHGYVSSSPRCYQRSLASSSILFSQSSRSALYCSTKCYAAPTSSGMVNEDSLQPPPGSAGQGGDDNGDGTPTSQPGRELRRRITVHMLYTGLIGSLAVLCARHAHIDLLGQFHPTTLGVVQAISLSSPLLLLDLLTLGPDWQRKRPAPPAVVALELRSMARTHTLPTFTTGNDEVASLGTDAALNKWIWPTLNTSLMLHQEYTLRLKTNGAPGNNSTVRPSTALTAGELALAGIAEFGQELFVRGIGFTVIAMWMHRAIEFELDEGLSLVPYLPGLTYLSTIEAGRFYALLLLLLPVIPSAADKEQFSRDQVAATLANLRCKRRLRQPTPTDEDLNTCKQLLPARFAGALAAGRACWKPFALCTAFGISGDLAATLVAAVLMEGLPIVYRHQSLARQVVLLTNTGNSTK